MASYLEKWLKTVKDDASKLARKWGVKDFISFSWNGFAQYQALQIKSM